VRVDDVRRHVCVGAAQEAIYVKNYTIDSTAVKNLLQEESLVPSAEYMFERY